MKLERFYWLVFTLMVLLFIGYAHEYHTKPFVLNANDTIVAKSELKMLHDAINMGCPKDTTIVNPVLYEMTKVLGEPKTFKVKRK